jgi:plasmid stabilization system protein ParE
MKSRFHDAADEELIETVAYYDGKAPGLGDRFLAEVKAATRFVEEYPEIAPVTFEGVRSRVLAKFPYSLLYVVDQHELYVLAVAHHSRRPAYWVDRLPQRG